jgi:Leucine-rich repeat (LRR) protein
MEISSDKIFSLIEKKMDKNKNKKKILLTIDEKEILTDGIIFNNSYISKIYFNSIDKKALYNFENLQYLSLTHNSLRNIDFIKHFPNLFYLDLYKNSIDDFKVLNKKNIFGYIRLSIDHFNEKKIL